MPADPLLQTRYFMSETDAARLYPSIAEVTFVGRSNVGKSSLLCGLCQNKKLARVSKLPGRTRQINVFETKKGRWLVDLPGYGFAAAPERQRDYWPTMIGTYLIGRPNLRKIYVLLDAQWPAGPIDLSMLKWLREKDLPHQPVATKVDRLSRAQQAEARSRLATSLGYAAAEIAWVSAKEGYGMKEFRANVRKALGLE